MTDRKGHLWSKATSIFPQWVAALERSLPHRWPVPTRDILSALCRRRQAPCSSLSPSANLLQARSSLQVQSGSEPLSPPWGSSRPSGTVRPALQERPAAAGGELTRTEGAAGLTRRVAAPPAGVGAAKRCQVWQGRAGPPSGVTAAGDNQPVTLPRPGAEGFKSWGG